MFLMKGSEMGEFKCIQDDKAFSAGHSFIPVIHNTVTIKNLNRSPFHPEYIIIYLFYQVERNKTVAIFTQKKTDAVDGNTIQRSPLNREG